MTWGRLDADKFLAVDDGSITVPVELAALITAVHVSPNANPEIEDAVRTLCHTSGVDVLVQTPAVVRYF